MPRRETALVALWRKGWCLSSQHTARCATEPRKHSGAACFAAGPHPATDGRTSVVLLMWNMRRRLSSHNWKTAAAEAAVKADRREPRSGRSVAQSLYGCRSGGYGASARKAHPRTLPFVFNRLPDSNFLLSCGYRKERVFLLVACFLVVNAR